MIDDPQVTDADRAKAEGLLPRHRGQCDWDYHYRPAGPGCTCLVETERAAVAAALAAARQEGRESVGLGDFLPNPCEEETRAPNWHFVETYGDWLPCTRRKGHDGGHEHEDSGLTWSTS